MWKKINGSSTCGSFAKCANARYIIHELAVIKCNLDVYLSILMTVREALGLGGTGGEGTVPVFSGNRTAEKQDVQESWRERRMTESE